MRALICLSVGQGMAMAGLPPQAIMGQMNAGQPMTRDDLRIERAPPRPAPTVKVADILKRPGRLKRPERIFIILRGLPGAGKTRVARTLRDIEVANGGEAPRVLSLDDYFLQEREVQKMDDDLGKEVTVTEMEYVYEADMEDVYKASVLKAFKKTIDQGLDKLIIYDAQNVRSEDFEDMWKYAKVKGYETFVMEVTASVAECAARNVHGRSRDEIALMAQDWEETPSYISKLTGLNTVLQTDDLSGTDVQEVEMDQEDDYQPGEEEGFAGAGATPPASVASAAGGSGGAGKASKWLNDDDDDDESGGEGGAGRAAKGGDAGGGDLEGPSPSKSRGLEHTDASSRDARSRPPAAKPKGVLRKVSKYQGAEETGGGGGAGGAGGGSGAAVKLVSGGSDDEDDGDGVGLMSLMGAYDDDDGGEEEGGSGNAEASAGGQGQGAAVKEGEGRVEEEKEEEDSRPRKRKIRWLDETAGNIESYDVKRQKAHNAGVCVCLVGGILVCAGAGCRCADRTGRICAHACMPLA